MHQRSTRFDSDFYVILSLKLKGESIVKKEKEKEVNEKRPCNFAIKTEKMRLMDSNSSNDSSGDNLKNIQQ